MRIEPWYAHFPKGAEDVDWLPVIGKLGWVALTKDKAIRRKPWEMDKVIAHGVRMFTLPNGNLSGDEMAQTFIVSRLRMARLLHNHPFPFVAVVSRTDVSLIRSGAGS